MRSNRADPSSRLSVKFRYPRLTEPVFPGRRDDPQHFGFLLPALCHGQRRSPTPFLLLHIHLPLPGHYMYVLLLCTVRCGTVPTTAYLFQGRFPGNVPPRRRERAMASRSIVIGAPQRDPPAWELQVMLSRCPGHVSSTPWGLGSNVGRCVGVWERSQARGGK